MSIQINYYFNKSATLNDLNKADKRLDLIHKVTSATLIIFTLLLAAGSTLAYVYDSYNIANILSISTGILVLTGMLVPAIYCIASNKTGSLRKQLRHQISEKKYIQALKDNKKQYRAEMSELRKTQELRLVKEKQQELARYMRWRTNIGNHIEECFVRKKISMTRSLFGPRPLNYERRNDIEYYKLNTLLNTQLVNKLLAYTLNQDAFEEACDDYFSTHKEQLIDQALDKGDENHYYKIPEILM